MADSFSKKENFKKKLQKQKEKAARREERKDSNDKGKTLDDMIMYVDHNGQFTSTPPVSYTHLDVYKRQLCTWF